MEAYKRWVRRNKEYVLSLESLANGLTWLLPERFSETEILPEADFMIFWVLARLALLHNSRYKMLLHGGETINDGKDPNDANRQGRNGNFTPELRALSALSRFGENARMISNPTWPPETNIKRPTLLSFLSEKGLPGGLMLTGEELRQEIYNYRLYGIRAEFYELSQYGPRSWLPWFISLTIDLIGMSSSTISLTSQKDRKLHLSDPEKDELGRRKLLLALYLMRDPCFGKYTRQRLESTEKTLEHVPVVGFLTAKLIELLVGAQTRYTYMSGS